MVEMIVMTVYHGLTVYKQPKYIRPFSKPDCILQTRPSIHPKENTVIWLFPV